MINLPITIDQLSILVAKTPVLIHLNIIGTRIGKKDLFTFVSTKKKYINNLKISEEQYSNRLLDKSSSASPSKIMNPNQLPIKQK